MKALTLWRPWPWAIFHAPHNPKRVENRTWIPPKSIIGKRIALHAGKKFDSDSADFLCSRYFIHPDGDVPKGWQDEGLIGVATVYGWAQSEDDCERFMVGQRFWFSGPCAWLLGDVHAFYEPIKCGGAQGLWDIPSGIEGRVRAKLEARALL